MSAGVQKEHGHSPIAHPILEALAAAGFSASQYAVLMVLIRETYGWSRRDATISLAAFQDRTRLHRNTVQRAVATLVAEGVMLVIEPATFDRNPATYRLQKDPREWGRYAYASQSLSSRGQSPQRQSHRKVTVTAVGNGTVTPEGNSHTPQAVGPQRVPGPQNKGKQVTTTPLTPRSTTAADAARGSGTGGSENAGPPKLSAMPYTADFEAAWAAYPARDGGNPKRRAFKAWCARLKEGADATELIAAAGEYADDCRRRGKLGTEYVMQAATFFGPDERWRAFVRQRQTDYERRHFPGLERKPGYVNPLLDERNVRLVDYDPWTRTRVA